MLLNLTHIGQIALPVADVDRSEAFYRDVLGLPKQYRFGDLTFFDCAGVRLLLEKSEGSITPQGCIYFRCADIALTVGELTRRGVTFTHKPHLIANGGSRSLDGILRRSRRSYARGDAGGSQRLRTAAALTRLAGLHSGWHLRYPCCGRSGGQRSA